MQIYAHLTTHQFGEKLRPRSAIVFPHPLESGPEKRQPTCPGGTAMSSRAHALIVNGLLLTAVSLLLCTAVVAQNNPVPLIYQPLTPDRGQPGGDKFALTVYGTGFVSGAVLNWNGSPRITVVVDSTHLHAQINASDVATTSTAAITVSNPSPGGGTSNVIFFRSGIKPVS